MRPVIFSRSQLVLPLQLLHCWQSICEFFMIRSASDIVLLQVGRVLISDDKSAIWHFTHNMSNTNLARIRLFGTSDALAGFPNHHLEHVKSPHCRGKSYHGQYSMFRSARVIVFCLYTLSMSSLLTLAVNIVFARSVQILNKDAFVKKTSMSSTSYSKSHTDTTSGTFEYISCLKRMRRRSRVVPSTVYADTTTSSSSISKCDEQSVVMTNCTLS